LALNVASTCQTLSIIVAVVVVEKIMPLKTGSTNRSETEGMEG
jgi:hypothetical protein